MALILSVVYLVVLHDDPLYDIFFTKYIIEYCNGMPHGLRSITVSCLDVGTAPTVFILVVAH